MIRADSKGDKVYGRASMKNLCEEGDKRAEPTSEGGG